MPASGPSVEIEWQGLDTLIYDLKQLSPRATAYLSGELATTAYEAFDQSQIQVPRRYGILAGSGNVTQTGDDPVEFTIGYGGPAAGYAFWVHENMQAKHKSPTKAKYLEDPANAAMAKMPGRMDGRVEGVIMGQYPQAPSIADAKGTASATVAHTGGRTRKGAIHKAVIARAQAMSTEDIARALYVIDHGHEVGKQKGASRTRTFRATGLTPHRRRKSGG